MTGEYKVVVLDALGSSSFLRVKDDFFSTEKATFKIEIKNESDLILFAFRNCFEEDKEIENVFLLADDSGYIPFITKQLQKGIEFTLFRKHNEESSMICEELGYVRYTYIDYLLGYCLGLDTSEL